MAIEKYDIKKLKKLQKQKKRGTLDKRMEPYLKWLQRRVEKQVLITTDHKSMSESDQKAIERFIERNHKKAGVKKIPGDTPLQKRINKNRIDSGREPKEFKSESQNEDK